MIARSALSWTTSDRTKDVEAHPLREYGEIGTPASKVRVLEEAGYSPVGFFILPHECWQEQYNAPLKASFGAFLDRHSHSDEARRIIEAEEQEMRMHHERGQSYRYCLCIASRPCEG